MNRFRLKLFCPPDDSHVDHNSSYEPRDILPFAEGSQPRFLFSTRAPAAIERARLLRENCECPSCQRHDIEPLELDDAIISSRSRLPVPGTATIVGFHCNDCGTEWPVYELTRRNG